MKDKLLSFLTRFMRAFWGMFSHNLGLKLLSLMCAVLLWSYVISSNPSITRSKTISGIDAYVTNQSVLNAYGLALADDPTALLEDVSVRLEVPQSSYALANAENVQVTLDLSNVRTAGVQEVPLRAATAYGRVLKILPETVTLAFEALDARSVPVNASVTGEKRAGMWYSISRINPEELVISGASSVVQSIASASVSTDITDRGESFVTAARFVLLDREGNEISQTLLNRSSSSVTVSVDVYPTKELTVSNEIANVLRGQVADGYEVTSITIQPESVTVAADAELLEALTELMIEPITVSDARQSFTQRARISSLTDFRYVSSEQVYVNVTIEEMQESAWLDVKLSLINCPDGLTFTYTREDPRVRVTGPISRVEALRDAPIEATVDLSGLSAGEYTLPITADEDMYAGLKLEFEPTGVSLRLYATSDTD